MGSVTSIARGKSLGNIDGTTIEQRLTEGTKKCIDEQIFDRETEKLLFGSNATISRLPPQSTGPKLQNSWGVCLGHGNLEYRHDTSED